MQNLNIDTKNSLNRVGNIPDSAIALIEHRVSDHLATLNHPYHNLFHTAVRVVPYAKEYGIEARLSPVNQQLLQIAAWYHDYGHAGSTFRQLVEGIERPDQSNEEFAADAAIRQTGHLLTIPQQEIVRGMILATSFGQNQLDKLPAEHAQNLYRSYAPKTNMEKLIAFADISNFRTGLESFLEDNLNVLAESRLTAIPPTFEVFVKNTVGFLGYVQLKLNDVKAFFSADYGESLQVQLDTLREQVSTISEIPWKQRFEEVRAKRISELSH